MDAPRHPWFLLFILLSSIACTASESGVIVGPPAPQTLDAGPDAMETIIEQNEAIFEEIAEGKKNHFIVDGDIYDPTANQTRKRRNAITDRRRLWPGGVVPYVIDGYFSTEQRVFILSAMQRFHEKTCIQFRPRTIERDYIVITEGEGCWSMIGRRGGRQTVSIGGTCKNSRGTIIHELMHALGFRHEHNRPDRDNYVVLYWQNIDKKMWDNFAKYSRRDVTLLDTGYDYLSLMHYPTYAFSKNGGQTIGTIYPTYEEPGTRNDFSYVDVYRITALYRCGACYDTDKDNCPTWAIMGECRRSSVWMQKYCPFSCESCNKAEYSGGDCRDYSNNCEKWSSHGECDRNPDFMSYNCKMSCGYCKAPNDVHARRECYDDSPLCGDWSQLGECYNNPEYMKKTCHKSCGVCVETDRDHTVGDGDCRDLHPLCHIWARHGVCQSYPEWMMENCALSCWRCANKTGVTVEIWDDTTTETDGSGTQKPPARRRQICQNKMRRCDQWADNGRCTREPDFMYKRCLKSCGMCIDERVTGVKAPTAKQRNKCADRFTTCKLWAGNGECDIATEWMEKNCPKSCDACPGEVEEAHQDCTDSYQRCPAWAAKGDCQYNPGWMNVYCRKTCQRCHERKTLPGCLDHYRRCKRLADGGGCRGDNSRWMRSNCPLSCGFCGVYDRAPPPPAPALNESTPAELNSTGGVCRDYHPHCQRWYQNGNCHVNVRYMKNHCRKSCGYCPTCFDKDANCRVWAKRGDCLSNPLGLAKACALSCGNCGRGPTECSDTHKQCPKWAKRGYCDQNTNFMHKFCKVSCRVCDSDETATQEPPTETVREGRPQAKSKKKTKGSNKNRRRPATSSTKRPQKGSTRPRKNKRPRKRNTQGRDAELN
ncbi:zinc metalloproteinase nas-36-like isoform X2 [Acanthaster planci]|uniref:Metalloendopeptidase n=1 Tax=Acanthaster planci TaxID=133434 RepID=A0A8B7XVE9_ACAPL|nr:zinc metalloproteinase nas-36-like isoform X2 [Acanthaster planci]